MPRLPRATVVVIALAFLPAASAQGQDPPVLTGIVGPNDAYVITLNDASGKKVAEIPAGTYTVVVKDESRIHNFHLASNEDDTVDFRTDVDFVGEQTFAVTFKPHTRYAYACEPHWQTMSGSFLVTGTDTSPPPPPAPAPVRTLKASVTPAGAIHLSVSSIAAGRYKLLVADRSRSANFHLVGRGLDRRTGKAFRGSVNWRVRLTRGTYRYGSDPALARRLRVR
jgi:plastocyanin